MYLSCLSTDPITSLSPLGSESTICTNQKSRLFLNFIFKIWIEFISSTTFSNPTNCMKFTDYFTRKLRYKTFFLLVSVLLVPKKHKRVRTRCESTLYQISKNKLEQKYVRNDRMRWIQIFSVHINHDV